MKLRLFFSSGAYQYVLFSGCGSIYYLSLAAGAVFRYLTGKVAVSLPASEIWLNSTSSYPCEGRGLLIAISRSGETTETIRACQFFREKGDGEIITLSCYLDHTKAAVFSTDGRLLALAYAEYDYRSPEVGWAELDVQAVWEKIKASIGKAVAGSGSDPVTALAVASLGEAVVPVSWDRRVLGPSLLDFDVRGQEYLHGQAARVEDAHQYQINGNTLGNHYSLTKLMWIRDNQAELYARTDQFLHWSSFVAFMLRADPFLDYTLANRTLLFDLDRAAWSEELVELAQVDLQKLPRLVPSGVAVGTVSLRIAQELGLPPYVTIASGSHDQCANAVGCGVIEAGQAFYGMGSYHCIAAVMNQRRDTPAMLARGLNTEHHAVLGKYVSFLYNHGGTLVKWYRDTFAAVEHRHARSEAKDVYSALFAEMPERISSVLVLPNFALMGPPEFLTDTCGVIFGLHLDIARGDVLKGIVEGIGFYLRECVESLPATGITISDYRAVGGGSKSDAWIQLSVDLFGQPIAWPAITEAGALGSAIMAGVGAASSPTTHPACRRWSGWKGPSSLTLPGRTVTGPASRSTASPMRC